MKNGAIRLAEDSVTLRIGKNQIAAYSLSPRDIPLYAQQAIANCIRLTATRY
jgi:hypothetical protein